MLSNFLSENFRLKTSELFEGLTNDELELLVSSGVTHVYKKGEIIFRDGGIPTGIFYVNTGMVKKYKETAKGGEQIFYICGEGELLGYHALLGEEYYPDSAATIENSEITFIPKESFLQVLRNSNKLSNRLLKALGHEFSLFINNITNLATKTVRERLAFNLLIMEEKFNLKPNSHQPHEIVMSRTDMANMVGTAKETLVRLLQEFKRDRLIETTGKSIRILDRKGIIREANIMGQIRKRPNLQQHL
jgi:CRP-like cAMP-binding protein